MSTDAKKYSYAGDELYVSNFLGGERLPKKTLDRAQGEFLEGLGFREHESPGGYWGDDGSWYYSLPFSYEEFEIFAGECVASAKRGHKQNREILAEVRAEEKAYNDEQ